MNIFRRLFQRSTPAAESNSAVAQTVVQQMLDDGNIPPEAADSLAEIADVHPATIELEVLTSEEFRARYRPRIAVVPVNATQLLATVDVSEG